MLGKQCLEATDLKVLLRSGKIHTLGTGRFAVVVRERVEVVVFLAVRGLQVEVLAKHIAVVIVGIEQHTLGPWLKVRGVTAAQFSVFQVRGGVVVQVGKVDPGAAMIA
ncbi:hypothetical protein D3C77_181670 [compost metagenome]